MEEKKIRREAEAILRSFFYSENSLWTRLDIVIKFLFLFYFLTDSDLNRKVNSHASVHPHIRSSVYIRSSAHLYIRISVKPYIRITETAGRA